MVQQEQAERDHLYLTSLKISIVPKHKGDKKLAVESDM